MLVGVPLPASAFLRDGLSPFAVLFRAMPPCDLSRKRAKETLPKQAARSGRVEKGTGPGRTRRNFDADALILKGFGAWGGY